MTDPYIRAEIFKSKRDFIDSILENALIRRFLGVGDLVEAIFESKNWFYLKKIVGLPMCTI